MSLPKRMLITLMFCCSVVTAKAADLSPGQGMTIWVMTWGQTHFIHEGDVELLNNPPTIHLMDQAALCNFWGRTLESCGPLKAVQFEDSIRVLETLDFDTALDASIILHEMVHYVQWYKHGASSGCDAFNANEKEARKVQAEVLAYSGYFNLARMVTRGFRPAVCI